MLAGQSFSSSEEAGITSHFSKVLGSSWSALMSILACLNPSWKKYLPSLHQNVDLETEVLMRKISIREMTVMSSDGEL